MAPSAILAETVVALAQANKDFPESARQPGHRMNRATIHRFVLHGRRARSGALVKLEAIRCGHSWFTSKEAIARFVDRLNDVADDSAAVRSPGEAKREAAKADAKLAAMGA